MPTQLEIYWLRFWQAAKEIAFSNVKAKSYDDLFHKSFSLSVGDI